MYRGQRLNVRVAKARDKQIEEDFSEGGAGMALLQRWDAEIETEKPVPLKEFLAQQETALERTCLVSP